MDYRPYNYNPYGNETTNVWPMMMSCWWYPNSYLANAYASMNAEASMLQQQENVCMNANTAYMNRMDTFQQQTNILGSSGSCVVQPRTFKIETWEDVYKALFPYDPIQEWSKKRDEELDRKYAWATEEHFVEVNNKVLRDAGIKKRFRLEDYCVRDWAMICETEEEAETFLEYLDAKGQAWRTGVRYTDHSNWFDGCLGMAYRFNLGTRCPVGLVKEKDKLYFKDYDWSWMNEHPLRTRAPKPQTVMLKG